MHNLTNNQQTLASYEVIALDYAESTKGVPSGVAAEGIGRLITLLPSGGTVLELGSGPGWDADHLETLGLRVRRTDATAAFCVFQTGRGQQADQLDAILDPLASPRWPSYDGVVALYVLQHIERDDTRAVLAKVAAVLRPGGATLLTVREGGEDLWEGGAAGHALRYHVTQWSEGGFYAALRGAGLAPTWHARHRDAEGDWLFVVARKPIAGGDVTADSQEPNR